MCWNILSAIYKGRKREVGGGVVRCDKSTISLYFVQQVLPPLVLTTCSASS
jgi:hypothetical protein